MNYVVVDIIFNGNNINGLHYVCNGEYKFVNASKLEVQKILENYEIIVCYNARQILKIDKSNYVDVGAFRKNNDFTSLIKSFFSDDDVEKFLSKKSKIEAHFRACVAAKIDIRNFSTSELVPQNIINDFYKEKLLLIEKCFFKIKDHEFKNYENNLKLAHECFYSIELNGIHIDSNELFDDPYSTSIKKLLNSENLIMTKFNCSSSKTGRVYTHGKFFNCVTIPKKPIRKAFNSRFDGGYICSFDFNAIDYRSIIYSIDNSDVKNEYSLAKDFHKKTTELVFGIGGCTELRRSTMKKILYAYFYGSSLNNMSKDIGLSKEKILLILDKIKNITSEIDKFSKKLTTESLCSGYVLLNNGFRVPLTHKEHAGQILSIYAQATSNQVFFKELQFLNSFFANKKSKIIMTIHDEVVADVHPDEIAEVIEMKEKIGNSSFSMFNCRFVANLKIGKNYWEMKDAVDG